MDFLDYVIVIMRWKKVLVSAFFLSLITSYLLIYFFIPKQYQATAELVPSMEENGLVGLSSLIKDFSSVLPSGLSSMKQESEMDLYNTIIYSRTSIELLIQRFDLQKVYKMRSRENAVKQIRKSIKTTITLENAFVLSVQSNSPQLACDMANYLVQYLNEKIIQMDVAKSKDNRIFLEQRYSEIKTNLKNAEDSLKAYQERTGVFEAGKQTTSTIETLAKLESDVAAKQVESNVLTKIYGDNSPMANNAKLSLTEYQNEVQRLKSNSNRSEIVIGLNSLPQKALDYFRYYRDVKIYDEMLQFIVPLYEQSKFEEQKKIPILQVIDYAVPPERKMYPPRIFMSGIIACMVLFFSVCYLIAKEALVRNNNPKIALIRTGLFKLR